MEKTKQKIFYRKSKVLYCMYYSSW